MSKPRSQSCARQAQMGVTTYYPRSQRRNFFREFTPCAHVTSHGLSSPNALLAPQRHAGANKALINTQCLPWVPVRVHVPGVAQVLQPGPGVAQMTTTTRPRL